MNVWHKGLWLVAGTLCLGCQNNGNYDLMERELRLQEDRIYQLEDELDRKCQLLATFQEENRTLKDNQDGSATRMKLSAPRTTPPVNGAGPLVPPKVEIDLPSPGVATPALPAPGANLSQPAPFDPAPALQTPQLNSPRRTDSDPAPLPAPVEAPAPRSLLDRNSESWQAAPEVAAPAAAPDRRPPSQARRPSWSPYR
jgi:hypothetical protein